MLDSRINTTVAGDVASIRMEGSALGLQLNAKKFELIQCSFTNSEAPSTILSSYQLTRQNSWVYR